MPRPLLSPTANATATAFALCRLLETSASRPHQSPHTIKLQHTQPLLNPPSTPHLPRLQQLYSKDT